MLFVKRIYLYIFLLGGFLTLTACMNSKATVNEMYEILEKVVETEKQFEMQQEPLVELEKKEQELYSQIIELGMKEKEQIKELATEAIKIVQDRKEHMDKEKESLRSSKQQFESILPLIEELDEETLQGQAKQLYDTMMTRYESHDNLYEQYLTGLELDQELYELFQKGNVPIETLEEEVLKINEAYEHVLESNKIFNEKTKEYNVIKEEFYESAGIETKK